MNKIKAYVLPLGGKAEIMVIDNTLERFQQIVGGCIETYTCDDGVVYIFNDYIFNEEGKLSGKLVNEEATECLRRMDESFKKYQDVLCGSVIIAGYTHDGDFTDIPSPAAAAAAATVSEVSRYSARYRGGSVLP